MAKTVVGLFDSPAKAGNVVEDLVKAGCRREDISVVAKDERGTGIGDDAARYPGKAEGEGADETLGAEGLATGAGIGAVLGGAGGVLAGLGMLAIPGIGPVVAAGPIAAGLVGAAGGAVAGGLIGGLVGLGVPEEESHAYAEGVRRGHTLVVARTSDEEAAAAATVMNRFNPIDIHTESTRWRQEGWSGRPGETAQAGGEQASIPVTEEQLVVGKRHVEGGGVRVHSHVTEKPVSAEVRLHQERVDVERMPADRPVSDSDRAFQERSVEMRETDEEAVVGKKARVVEEVRVRKAGEDREENVKDTVRRTDVDVDRTGREKR